MKNPFWGKPTPDRMPDQREARDNRNKEYIYETHVHEIPFYYRCLIAFRIIFGVPTQICLSDDSAPLLTGGKRVKEIEL